MAGGHAFAGHWLHNGMLTAGGEKMSKSVGNVVSLDELLANRDARALRLLVLRSHYRSQMEVSPGALDDAQAALDRLNSLSRRFPQDTPDGATGHQGFIERMDDDLDTPGAVAHIFNLVREANLETDASHAARLATQVRELCSWLGLELDRGAEVDEATAELVSRREQARANKDWSAADALRAEIEAAGWTIEDSPDGTKVWRSAPSPE